MCNNYQIIRFMLSISKGIIMNFIMLLSKLYKFLITMASSQTLPKGLPSSYQLQNNVLPLQKQLVNYNSSYTQDYKKHGGGGSAAKVTRFDLINKNYIFPQDKFNNQSSYTDSYKNNGEINRAERVTHKLNEVLPKGKFEGNSSYLDTYVNSQGTKRQLMKHEGQLKLGGKFEGSSNYADNYPNKGVPSRQEKVVFADNKILPEGKFDNTSTYAGNYLANPAQVTRPIKKEGELRVGGKFEGNSSYAEQYDERNRNIAKRQQIQFKDNQIMPKGQFESYSTYQSNYINTEHFTPSKLVKQQQQLQVGGEFYGSSNYALNYDNKGLSGKPQKVVHSNNKIFTQGKFDDSTTYTGNYIQNPLQRKEMFKPEGQLKVNGGIFNANSSYGSDYIKPQGEARQKTISYPTNDVIPRGNFVGSSTYGDNYVPSAIQRRDKMIPEDSLKLGGGKFQANSHYTQNYDGSSNPPKYLNRQNDYSTVSKQK